MILNPIKANMTELELNGMKVLFSYRTPVAMSEVTPEGKLFYRTSTRWSNTTQRHINSWLPKTQAIEKPQDFFDSLTTEVK